MSRILIPCHNNIGPANQVGAPHTHRKNEHYFLDGGTRGRHLWTGSSASGRVVMGIWVPATDMGSAVQLDYRTQNGQPHPNWQCAARFGRAPVQIAPLAGQLLSWPPLATPLVTPQPSTSQLNRCPILPSPISLPPSLLPHPIRSLADPALLDFP